MADANYLIWAGLAAAMVGLSKGGLPTVGMLSVPILSLFMSPVKAVVMLLPPPPTPADSGGFCTLAP